MRSRRTWLGVPAAMAADHPPLVVRPLELAQRLDQIRHRGEAPHPQELLLQGADEPLGAPVPLRLPHEARRAGHAEEPQLALEVVAEVVAPVVVPDGQALGGPGLELAEVLPHALPERLQGLEAVAP